MIESGVQVALRVRPFINNEINAKYYNILETFENKSQVIINGTNRSFNFNYVFDSNCSQKKFYNDAIRWMIPRLFQGYNVTVLAYGQTGSGKSYTMGTLYDDPHQCGIVQRSIEDVFYRIKTTHVSNDYRVTLSFVELYQEVLYDLLAEQFKEQTLLEIREDTNCGIKIVGAREISVKNVEEISEYLKQGSKYRATGATAINAQSSRSHALITLTIYQNKKDSNAVTISKFNLVDLAGSERSKKTKTTGERFKEGVKINQGLLALGNVISALGEDVQKVTYIPYRDSKLTRLLQNSLGGNSITLMIACVSSSSYNLDETLSTLRYADRVRKIKNQPKIIQDIKKVENEKLNLKIKELEAKIAYSEIKYKDYQNCLAKNEMLKIQNAELYEKILHLEMFATKYDGQLIQQKLFDLFKTYQEILNKLNLNQNQYEIISKLGFKINDILVHLLQTDFNKSVKDEENNQLTTVKDFNIEETKQTIKLLNHLHENIPESSQTNQNTINFNIQAKSLSDKNISFSFRF